MTDDTETTTVRRTVRLAVILLVVGGLYLAGFAVLLSVVVGMIPLWYTSGWGAPTEVDDETEPQNLAQRLHRAHRVAWHELADRAHLIDFLRSRPGRAGKPSLLPPRVAHWPPTPAPFCTPGPVTAEQVAQAVKALGEQWRTLVITGGEDTGKTTLMLLMLLQAEHERDVVDPNAPVPLRISLAGWPDDPDLTLREWLARRVREDYPGLLGPGQSLDRLLDWLWGADELAVDHVLLFVDGIDVIPDSHRARVLDQVLTECDGRLAVIACRTSTWAAVPGAERRDWVELQVVAPDRSDLRTFLAPVPMMAERLENAGPATERLWRNPRLLQLLREAYPDPGRPPAWLDPAPTDPATARRAMWADLLDRVAWPTGVGRDRVLRTLRWIAGQGLFADTRFEWWQVPGRAAQDPALAPAHRLIQLRRTGSAVLWALGAFGAGLIALTVLLALGNVQGYDHASRGLLTAGALRARDVRDWSWDLLSIPHVLGNPVYLACLQALLAVLVVAPLAWFGRELEHPDGGQPQTLRLGLPSGRQLPLLIRALPRKALLVLGIAVLLGGLLELSGSGAGRQVWASCAFAALFLALLTWLHWCAEAPTEPSRRTPAGLFAADRDSTRIVAMSVGGTLAVTAGVLSWWFTAFGHVPTVGQCLGIITAVSVAIGVGRGLFLGAGMGTAWMIRLRPGFGLGYGARLIALEQALKRRPPGDDAAAPLAVTGLLRLAGTPAKTPNPASRTGLPPEALLRPVGSHIRLRETSLETHLGATAAGAGRPDLGERGDRATWLTAVAIVPAVVLALLTATGSAAVMLPRLPCFTWRGAVSAPSGLAVDEWRGKPRSRTWLENGQCVGFVVPGAEGWPRGSFAVPGGISAGQEHALNEMMTAVAAVNRRIPADDTKAVTVLFLAPLTRTDPGNAINGLWQLHGALAALKGINDQGSLPVRLVVANSGENFTSGPSVVQTIVRSFPRSGPWAIQAVIGVSQSRSSARSALAELRRIPVIAASVNGRQLRQGIGSESPLRTRFESVSPGDDQVAQAVLDPGLLAAVRRRDPGATGPPTVRVVGDVKDPYFSNELMIDLVTAARQQGRGLVLGRSVDVSETAAGDRMSQAGRDLCADPHAIWLFTGRGNQLTDLDHRIDGRCKPLIIGGPGAVSAVAASDEPTATLTSMANLFSYSLVSRPFAPGLSVDERAGAVAVARGSDRATGYTALLAVAHLQSEAACPGPVGPLGLRMDANGHNTLAAGDDSCAVPEGTTILFCPFQGGTGCVPAAPASTAGARRTVGD
jgi:hypothetical protein